ncbi:unnamed protein product [Rhizophagus irregularis]|nr:unnamed protein product [Rhizophagus irregularis]
MDSASRVNNNNNNNNNDNYNNIRQYNLTPKKQWIYRFQLLVFFRFLGVGYIGFFQFLGVGYISFFRFLGVVYMGFNFRLGFGYMISAFGWALDIWVSFGYIGGFLSVLGGWIYRFQLSVLGFWIYRSRLSVLWALDMFFQLLGFEYMDFGFQFLGFWTYGSRLSVSVCDILWALDRFPLQTYIERIGFPLRILVGFPLSDFCQIAE